MSPGDGEEFCCSDHVSPRQHCCCEAGSGACYADPGTYCTGSGSEYINASPDNKVREWHTI
jgi:hypothetical protein